jgi:hypothetical protein
MQIEYTSHPFRTLSDYETGEIKEKKTLQRFTQIHELTYQFENRVLVYYF